MSVSSDQWQSSMVTTLHNRIPIRRRELSKFFAVDAHGNRLTLGEYIELSKRGKTNGGELLRRRSADVSTTIVKAGDLVFKSEDIEKLVDQYLESIAENEVFEIVGLGSFTKDQLRDEVKQGTSIGLQITQMILDDRNYVEEQINRGNYELPE